MNMCVGVKNAYLLSGGRVNRLTGWCEGEWAHWWMGEWVGIHRLVRGRLGG